MRRVGSAVRDAGHDGSEGRLSLRLARDIALIAAAFALCPLAAPRWHPDDPGGAARPARRPGRVRARLGALLRACTSGAGSATGRRWRRSPASCTCGATCPRRSARWCGRGSSTRGASVSPATRSSPRSCIVVAGYLVAFPTAPPWMLSGGRHRRAAWVAPDRRARTPRCRAGTSRSRSFVAGVVARSHACALAARRRVALYPLLVTAVVVVTANHFWARRGRRRWAPPRQVFALAVMARTLRGPVRKTVAAASPVGR